MKFLKYFSFFLAAAFLFISCQKEYSYEDGATRGSLVKDAIGDCGPVQVNGIYKKDSVLGAGNFVDVQINTTTTGTYDIKTDTVNGYSFRAIGSVAIPGINMVRLVGSGKPINAQTDIFSVKFDTSVCKINIDVMLSTGGGTTAVFTLGGSGSTCTGGGPSGTYTSGIAMTAANTANVGVTVQTPGSYNVSTTTANGVTFTGTGILAAGATSITLTAMGTPAVSATPVTTPYSITVGTGTCGFSITYAATPAPATYTVTCGTGSPAGVYQAGTAMTSSNFYIVSVTPQTTGSYTITTNSANGVTFTSTGVFSTTTAQSVTLFATGTPLAAGPFNYTTTGGTGSCVFPVTYTAGAGPAAYTINCTGATLQGNYAAGVPLDPSNTMTISVNATTAGTYTITSTTVNGVTFSATGTLVVGNNANIVLMGTGTPTAGGSFAYPLSGSGASCSVNVVYDFLIATIDGVAKTFNHNLTASVDNTSVPGFDILTIDGFAAAAGNEEFLTGVGKATGVPLTVGTYTINQFVTGVIVGANYTDAASANFAIASNPAPQTPVFTITITAITATRVEGTFSGPLKDANGSGAVLKTVTLGSFSVKR